MVMSECVGPRCMRKRSARSMSGRTEAARRSGRFTGILAILDDVFPNMYPRAK